MKTLTIRDVEISFPFEPYPCQLEYMAKVIEALDMGANAMLESPTGTGKTLCLLAATLAWAKKRKSKTQNGLTSQKVTVEYESQSSNEHANQMAPPGRDAQSSQNSVIIYASRTHSQLTQVISELRASGYTPKMTVMGSREQLCIHEKNSKLKGVALNNACSVSGAQRKCTYKNNLESYTSSVGIVDIEELAELGREDKVCPYFLSRQNATSSELILLPYNYLIDSSIRATLKVDWTDAIVIMDEAHNLERVASDASSFSLSSADIANCIKEMKNVIKLLQMHPPSQSTSDVRSFAGVTDSGRKPSLQRCTTILEALFNLEVHIDKVPLSTTSAGVKMTGGAKCAVLPGSWLVNSLSNVGINTFTAPQLLTEIELCGDLIIGDINSIVGGSNFGGSSSGFTNEPKLFKFAASLKKIFKTTARKLGASLPVASDFRVFIKEESQTNRKGNYLKRSGETANADKKRVLNYWCFSPGIAMEDLKSLGVRSLILTSGTLSPMEAFKEDLKVPFTVELENPHVIDNNQIWVAAMATGSNGGELLSTYERRDTYEYKDELGKSILSICQNMIGGRMNDGTRHPKLDGGVLVFFPSYGTLENTSARWKDSGLWNQLSLAMGKIVSETQAFSTSSQPNVRFSNNRSFTSHEGSGNRRTPRRSDGEQIDDKDQNIIKGLVEEFEGALAIHKKCLMLAVCRGKVSEGIDFKDNKGRVVIVTGIPFSPFMDPWVVLKKQYLDDNCKQRGLFFSSVPATIPGRTSTGPSSQYQPSDQLKPSSLIVSGTMQNINPKGQTNYRPGTSEQSSGKRLSGQAWYVQSASRAVNQALGRVIRHRHDWGAVFLLDKRYQRSDQLQQLSGWIRPRVGKHENFHSALLSFRTFCTDAMQNKSLAVREEVVTNFADCNYRKPFVPPTLKKNATGLQKSIVVKSSALKGEDIHYIDPSITMSQNTYEKSENIHRVAPASKSYASITNQPEPIKPSNLTSISKMFSIIKKSHSNTTMSSAAVTSTTTNTALNGCLAPFKVPVGRPQNKVLERKKSESSISSSLSQPLKGRGDQRTGLNRRVLTQNDVFTCTEKHGTTKVYNSENPVASRNVGENTKTSFNTSVLRDSSLPDEKKRRAESKEKFKSLIGKLDSKLTPKCFKSFINEIKKIAALSKASGGRIENLSELRNFVRTIVRILVPELAAKPLRETIDVLSTLFQEKHLNAYTAAAEHCLSTSTNSRSRDPQLLKCTSKPQMNQETDKNALSTPLSMCVQPPVKDSQFMPKNASACHNSPLISEGSKNKRGYQMMNNMKRPVSNSASSPQKDIFSALKSINFKKNKQCDTSSESSQTQLEKAKKARLDCIICTSTPSNPLINECGHICCEECWDTWLKMQRTCPICRIETHKSNLSKLILK